MVIDRCHQCGAVRKQGDAWIATLGAAAIAHHLGALQGPSPLLESLAEHWQHVQAAGGCAFATEWQPWSAFPADLVQPADEIPLGDLFAYDCGAASCVPPQIGVPVHAPHLRTLLAAYMAVQIATVVAMQGDQGGQGCTDKAPPQSTGRLTRPLCMARARAARS